MTPRWACDVCDQVVESVGPWCDLYCQERRLLCLALVMEAYGEALRDGDAQLAGRLLEYRDRHWPGQNLS